MRQHQGALEQTQDVAGRWLRTLIDRTESGTPPSATSLLPPGVLGSILGRLRRSRWARMSMSRTPAWRARCRSRAVLTTAICGAAVPLTGGGGTGGTAGGAAISGR